MTFPTWLGGLTNERETVIKTSPDGNSRLAQTQANDGSWGLTAHEARVVPSAGFIPTLAVEHWQHPDTGEPQKAILVTDSFHTYFPFHDELVASQVAMLEVGRSIGSNTFKFGRWSPEAEQSMVNAGVLQRAPDADQVDLDATARALEAQFQAADFSHPPQIILKQK